MNVSLFSNVLQKNQWDIYVYIYAYITDYEELVPTIGKAEKSSGQTVV
jgi:hypothetical protein